MQSIGYIRQDKNNRFQEEQYICICKDRHTYSKEFIKPRRDVF